MEWAFLKKKIVCITNAGNLHTLFEGFWSKKIPCSKHHGKYLYRPLMGVPLGVLLIMNQWKEKENKTFHSTKHPPLFSFWISSNLSSDENEICSYFSIIAAKNSPSVDVASLSLTCSPCKFSYKKRGSLSLSQLYR